MKDLSKESDTGCLECGGKGYTIKHNPKGQDIVSFCHCREVDKSKDMWRTSGIEAKKSRLTFGNYKSFNTVTEKAKAAAIEYFKNFKDIKVRRRNSIAFLG